MSVVGVALPKPPHSPMVIYTVIRFKGLRVIVNKNLTGAVKGLNELG